MSRIISPQYIRYTNKKIKKTLSKLNYTDTDILYVYI